MIRATKEEKCNQITWDFLTLQVIHQLAENLTRGRTWEISGRCTQHKPGRTTAIMATSRGLLKSSAQEGRGSDACCEVRGQRKSKPATQGLRLLVYSSWRPSDGATAS